MKIIDNRRDKRELQLKDLPEGEMFEFVLDEYETTLHPFIVLPKNSNHLVKYTSSRLANNIYVYNVRANTIHKRDPEATVRKLKCELLVNGER